MTTIGRPSRRYRTQQDVIERHVVMLTRQIRPTYIDAIAAQATGRDAREYWDHYQRSLTRAYVLIGLLGHAWVRDGSRAALPPVPPQQPVVVPDIAAFALIDIRGLMSGPFVEAVNAFIRRVPGLKQAADRLLSIGAAVATESRTVEEAGALTQLGRTIAREMATEAAPADPVLAKLPEQVVADALSTSAGLGIVENRLETSYRTALMHGFNQGAKEQRQGLTDYLPVSRLEEIQDRRTRGNPKGLYPKKGKHWQMHGFVASTTDPVWERITPPNGYGCRGIVRAVPRAEAKRKGWLREDGSVDVAGLRRTFAAQWAIIEGGEYPDPGFK